MWRCLALLSLTCALAPSTCARADDVSSRFGRAGQLAPFGAVGAWLTLGDQASKVKRDFALGGSPGLWLFPVDNLALGVALHGYYGRYALTFSPYSEAEIGASVGCGFNLPLQDLLSLFPRVWVGAGYLTQTVQLPSIPNFRDPSFTLPSSRTSSEFYGSVELQVPLLFELATTTFLEVGPFGRFRMANETSSNSLRFGLFASIGRVF